MKSGCTLPKAVTPAKPWNLVNSRENTPPAMTAMAYTRDMFRYFYVSFSFRMAQNLISTVQT